MCVDTSALRKRIADKGLSIADISGKIGIDQSTFYRKLEAGEKFSIGEAHRIVAVLGLSDKDAMHIFLSRNSHKCESA